MPKFVYRCLKPTLIMTLASCLALSACGGVETRASLTDTQRNSIKIVKPSDIEYVPLNPARGDAAPQAGMLWGNLREDVPTGMILKFADGFDSPPHIHNITYRGVVISGALHNDDPGAEKMWMESGSYWMQPAGENHVTSARPGAPAVSFLEILEGPYLVQPSDKAFDNGERPLNVDRSNIVWMDNEGLEWITADAGVETAMLWGSKTPGEARAAFIKLPAKASATLSALESSLHAVLIEGDLLHRVSGSDVKSDLSPGGYISSDDAIRHDLTCKSISECLLYVRSDGRFAID